MSEIKKNIVGRVTPAQRDEIQKLNGRKIALRELFMIVKPENNELYERIVADMTETQTRFDQWWSDRSKEYAWESSPNGHWQINFETCEILLDCDSCNCDNCQQD